MTLIYAAALHLVGLDHLTRYSLICSQVELNLLSLPLKQRNNFFLSPDEHGYHFIKSNGRSDTLVYVVNRTIISKERTIIQIIQVLAHLTFKAPQLTIGLS